MRLLALCLLALLAVAGFRAQNSAAVWHGDLETAMKQAQMNNKPIMAVFSGSDWGKLYQLLKQEVLEQPEFEQYAKDTFVLARFDFPRSKKNALSAEQAMLNAVVAAQLNPEGNFPLVVVLSPEGNVLVNTSYQPGGPCAYGAYLNQLLAQR